MKSVFIAFDQAYKERVVDLLTPLNFRGFSMMDQWHCMGSVNGDPHYGNHAWPSMCSGIITIVEDSVVDLLLERLHQMDIATEKLGLRAFVWNIEKAI